MIRLLDVNVLVALAWPNHAHHGPARAWALEQADRGWATSPVTELGFLRLSTTEHVVGAKVSPVQALELLRRLVAHPAHEFWPDDVRLIDGAPVRLATARQMTDAHALSCDTVRT